MLPIIIAAALLAGYATGRELSKRRQGPTVIRRVYRVTEGGRDVVRGTELLSEQALLDVGEIFDLDLASWWPMVQTGLYRAFTLVEIGGDTAQAVVLRVRRQGDGWVLDVAYGPGMKTPRVVDEERLSGMIWMMNQQGVSEGAQAPAPVEPSYAPPRQIEREVPLLPAPPPVLDEEPGEVEEGDPMYWMQDEGEGEGEEGEEGTGGAVFETPSE